MTSIPPTSRLSQRLRLRHQQDILLVEEQRPVLLLGRELGNDVVDHGPARVTPACPHRTPSRRLHAHRREHQRHFCLDRRRRERLVRQERMVLDGPGRLDAASPPTEISATWCSSYRLTSTRGRKERCEGDGGAPSADASANMTGSAVHAIADKGLALGTAHDCSAAAWLQAFVWPTCQPSTPACAEPCWHYPARGLLGAAPPWPTGTAVCRLAGYPPRPRRTANRARTRPPAPRACP